MKQITIALFLLISFGTFAQDNYYEDGLGFNSFFQKHKEGKYTGFASGLLLVKDTTGKLGASVFTNSDASLNVEYEPNEIYDVSYKKYICESEELKVEYVTYNYANSLKVEIEGESYGISLIDGACLGIIKGLDYEYVKTDKKELLILHFKNDVGLYSTCAYTNPEVFILKGSTLILQIQK